MMCVPRAIALMLLIVAPTMAQDPSELLSTRPEKSEPPDIVERGILQIESSVYVQHAAGALPCSLESVERARRNHLASGSWLLRIGLDDRIELRIEGSASREELTLDSCASSRRIDARLGGFSAPAVGMKMHLLDEGDFSPRLAIAASVTLQDEGSGIVADLAPSLRLTASRSLGEDLSIVANIATSWDGSSVLPAASYTLSLSSALSESIGVYAGIFGDLAMGDDVAHSADVGVSYAFSDALGVELFGALGLVESAPKYYAGIGVAVAIR
jgi:hypothetical protein